MTTTLKTYGVEKADGAGATLGESPIWDDVWGLLVWVDAEEGTIVVADRDGRRVRSIAVGGYVGAAIPSPSGWLIAGQEGMIEVRVDGSRIDVAEILPSGQGLRLNDARVDSFDRVWTTVVREDRTPGSGRLVSVGPGGDVRMEASALTFPNGIGWNPSQTELYVVDSLEECMHAYAFDEAIGRRMRTLHLAECPGRPDGIAVDVEGGIWAARWGGSSVRRYAPDGELIAVVELPTPQVTSCGFVDERLFITTAARGLPPSPDHGALYVAEVGVAGVPVHRWCPSTAAT